MISIVIPAHGEGAKFLPELLLSINSQRFRDVEVIVSGDETVPKLAGFCFLWNVRYVEGVPGAAANLNNVIAHARGQIIKPMFQDDKFLESDTLEKIHEAFYRQRVTPKWIVCNSQNGGDEGMRSDLFKPYPHRSVEALREGENTYGSPSAIAWLRNYLRFDERLHWLFDCEFYGRMAERYGVPAFIDSPIFIRQWSGMATEAIATGAQRILDGNYVVEKYRDHEGQPFG